MSAKTTVDNIALDLSLRAKEIPDRPGITFEDGRHLTYSQWDRKAGRIAGLLRREGVLPGNRVALYLQNSLDLAAALFGCWKIGAVPVTLSVMYNAEELRSALSKTVPVCIITHASKISVVEKAGEFPYPANWSAKILVAPEPSGETTMFQSSMNCIDLAHECDVTEPVESLYMPSPDDEGTILFTGGTTGLPKAVTVTHLGTRNSLRILAQASKRGVAGPYGATPEEVSPNLLTLPLFHSGGQQALLFALHVGRSIVVMERFRVQTLSRLVGKHKIDNLFLMPTMLYDIVHSKEKVEISSVRSVLIAGQALDPTLKQDFESKWGIPIFSNYGSTEIGHVAGWTSADIKAGRWKAGPVGRIYEGVEVEIRDGEGSVVSENSVGEIWVKGGNTKGYVDGTNVSAETLIVDGWVASGDVGYTDGDDFLYLVGRQRDMIKTGGFQVWPQEIEQILRTHPIVADVAVVGVRDERLGEIPKAFIVLSDGVHDSVEVVERELINFCKNRLSHFKSIRSVEIIAELPRSEAGKVQRGELISRWHRITTNQGEKDEKE